MQSRRTGYCTCHELSMTIRRDATRSDHWQLLCIQVRSTWTKGTVFIHISSSQSRKRRRSQRISEDIHCFELTFCFSKRTKLESRRLTNRDSEELGSALQALDCQPLTTYSSRSSTNVIYHLQKSYSHPQALENLRVYVGRQRNPSWSLKRTGLALKMR